MHDALPTMQYDLYLSNISFLSVYKNGHIIPYSGKISRVAIFADVGL